MIEAMAVLAIFFVIGCMLRIVLLFFDDGFGGPVWMTIFYSSSLTWGVGLALSILAITQYQR